MRKVENCKFILLSKPFTYSYFTISHLPDLSLSLSLWLNKMTWPKKWVLQNWKHLLCYTLKQPHRYLYIFSGIFIISLASVLLLLLFYFFSKFIYFFKVEKYHDLKNLSIISHRGLVTRLDFSVLSSFRFDNPTVTEDQTGFAPELNLNHSTSNVCSKSSY